MKKIKLIILILFIILISCQKSKKDNDNMQTNKTKLIKKTIKFDSLEKYENNLNFNIMIEYSQLNKYSKKERKLKYNNIIAMLDSLIMDSKSKIFFIQTKIRIFNEEKQYDKVINLIDTLKLIDSKLNKTILDDYKIKFYLKAKDVKNAKLLYDELEAKDNKILSQHPDSVGVIVNSLYRQLLFEDKSIIIRKFEDVKSKFPKNEYVLAFDQLFKDFDKKKEIENLSF